MNELAFRLGIDRSAYGQGFAVLVGTETEQERDCGLGPPGGVGVLAGLGAEAASEHGGINDSRVQGDGGQAAGQFLGEGTGQALDRPLGGTVRGRPRETSTGPIPS